MPAARLPSLPAITAAIAAELSFGERLVGRETAERRTGHQDVQTEKALRALM